MPQRLFVFVQMEFPWLLGPVDSRYLLRGSTDGEPQHVVVIETLATARADAARTRLGSRASLRRRAAAQGAGAELEPQPQPERVSSTRVTVIDPVPLSAENQARAWLDDLDGARDVHAAVTVVNRVLYAHRIASADAYVHEVSAAQALVVRAGWGEGEQVAEGRWLHARELASGGHGRRLAARPRGRDSAAGSRELGGPTARGRAGALALRPPERLSELLGAHDETLLCEELALRARLDFDQGRPRHAALELDDSLALARAELRTEDRQDLLIRIAELEQLHSGVAEQARQVREHDAAALDEDALEHALERLEAALRARSATGFKL
jgi:hypothetical protein